MAENFLETLKKDIKNGVLYPDAKECARKLGLDKIKKMVKALVKIAKKKNKLGYVSSLGCALDSYHILPAKWIRANVCNPPANYVNRGAS